MAANLFGGRLGADYYINETNTLSFQVNSSPNNRESNGFVRYDNFDADSALSHTIFDENVKYYRLPH